MKSLHYHSTVVQQKNQWLIRTRVHQVFRTHLIRQLIYDLNNFSYYIGFVTGKFSTTRDTANN